VRIYRFFQVDVFTDKPFGGNPLAVFPEAEGLSDREMQQLAKEMNLSETTFVLPPTDPRADFRVRIFTPAAEVPFAGHPVLGTHFVLAQLGRIALKPPVTRIHQELRVGILPVDLYVQDGKVQKVVMTQDKPAFLREVRDIPKLAMGLGIPAKEILSTGLPVEVVSTGLPGMMIPVRSLASVQVAKPHAAVLMEIGQSMGTDCFMIFTMQTLFAASTVHSRMFAPGFGITEDPATGSASGALGAYLVKHRAAPVDNNGKSYIVNEQGYEIDRPSTIYIEVEQQGKDIIEVRVGGQVTPLIEGVVHL
jgi:trans-2,3-dihydro-3-hydroxyanthranilate isomerase